MIQDFWQVSGFPHFQRQFQASHETRTHKKKVVNNAVKVHAAFIDLADPSSRTLRAL